MWNTAQAHFATIMGGGNPRRWIVSTATCSATTPAFAAEFTSDVVLGFYEGLSTKVPWEPLGRLFRTYDAR